MELKLTEESLKFIDKCSDIVGNFENEIERIYLDCIANDGRSILDAIAIELQYGEQLRVKGYFPLELMKKVQEENQLTRINESISA